MSFQVLVRCMNPVRRLDRAKNAPLQGKVEIGLKVKLINSSFNYRVSSRPESVASYCKMGR